MGVDYRGAIVLGYTYNEAEHIATSKDCDRDDLDLEQYGPYYDADCTDSIFGECMVRSSTYHYASFDTEDLDNSYKVRADEMEEEFGIRPEMYIMAQGF